MSSPTDFMSEFTRALEHPGELIDEISQSGKKAIGYFCTYTPVELIHATGAVPVRISGGPMRIDRADGLVPSFVCPYMRAGLERALSGDYENLFGLVQGYSCDVACGMFNVWKGNIPLSFYHILSLPYGDSSSAKLFFEQELKNLTERLADHGLEFSDTALSNSLDIYDDIRLTVLWLYDKRYKGELLLSAGDFYTVIRGVQVTPPERAEKLLSELVSSLKANTEKGSHTQDGTPILVSGSLVEDRSIFDLIERSGGRIVADDLCTGFRYFDPPSGDGKKAVHRLIERSIAHFPCPSRQLAKTRAPLLLDLARRSGARGVVFLIQKFCTPHLTDIPIVGRSLREEGVPYLVIEIEETGVMEGQAATRLQGFFEMIGD
ncbi:MAG: 2-hydroxyacyl-CoA dehydratase [Deltaproteobacteria bacterium]|nr:2-hydroxyacyl-CoA dehydratase [Candidatus Zymogenaceae bacterium]